MTRNQTIATLKAKLDAARIAPTLTVVAPPKLQPRELFLQVGNRRYQVASFEQASQMFCTARDRNGEGASKTPSPQIVDRNGNVIAHVSYNGRVWAGAVYVAGAKPLCEAAL